MAASSMRNKVVAALVTSDLIILSAGALLTPIHAIFITDQIEGATIATVGFVSAVFLVTKAIAQIFVSKYADARPGEQDDYRLLLIGSALASLVPLLYYFFATKVWHLYALEALNGVAFAMAVPTWLVIFAAHLDKNRESSQWTLHSNVVGLGSAAAGAAGGLLAEHYGFRALFLVISALSFTGTVALLFIREELFGTGGLAVRAEARAAEPGKNKIVG